MKLLEKLKCAAVQAGDIKEQLFAFLGSDAQEFTLLGRRTLSRQDARDLLQELIPARIEVRGVCRRPIAATVAAPHVSFDNWSEYFCNRIARKLCIGWVIAKNYRDQHSQTIPVWIGRHIHVNRPTESDGPGQTEYETERSREAYRDYLAAIESASGRGALPVDLLLEIHSHHRSEFLEIASSGVTEELARSLLTVYNDRRIKRPGLPVLRIAPIHKLRLSADTARKTGSIRTEIARVALHIEVPREARQDENVRQVMCAALIALGSTLLDRLCSEKTDIL